MIVVNKAYAGSPYRQLSISLTDATENIKNKYLTAKHILTTDNVDIFDTFLADYLFHKQQTTAMLYANVIDN